MTNLKRTDKLRVEVVFVEGKLHSVSYGHENSKVHYGS